MSDHFVQLTASFEHKVVSHGRLANHLMESRLYVSHGGWLTHWGRGDL